MEELERWQSELLQCTEVLEQARLELVGAAQQKKGQGAESAVDLTALQEKLQRVPSLLKKSHFKIANDSSPAGRGSSSQPANGVLVKLCGHTDKLLELAMHTLEQHQQEQENSRLVGTNQKVDRDNVESSGVQLQNENKDLRHHVSQMVELLKDMRDMLKVDCVTEKLPADAGTQENVQEDVLYNGRGLEKEVQQQSDELQKQDGMLSTSVDHTEDSRLKEAEAGIVDDQQGNEEEHTPNQLEEEGEESSHHRVKSLDLGKWIFSRILHCAMYVAFFIIIPTLQAKIPMSA